MASQAHYNADDAVKQMERWLAASRPPWAEPAIIPIDEDGPYIDLDQSMAKAMMNSLIEQEAETFGIANAEYAAGTNVMGNFNRIAARLKLTPEKVLLVYAMKHMDGIVSWVNGNEAHREPINGRIVDLRIYLLLLHMMVKAREHGWTTDKPE